MTPSPALSHDETLDLVRAGWYSHDARWFNAVAAEFGIDAANRLNQRAVVALGVAEARRLAKALGRQRCEDLGAFLDFVQAGRAAYVPPSLIEMHTEQRDETSYDVSVDRCFVAENISRAGMADSYRCAVFHRLQGWHDAMGLPLAKPCPDLACALAAGNECRRTLRVSTPVG